MDTGRLTGAERQLSWDDSNDLFHFDNKENIVVDITDNMPASVRVARTTLKANRSRDRVFADSLFSDPAWDIMLSLYVAAHDGLLLPLDDIGAHLPGTPSTIARYVLVLEDRGLVTCETPYEDDPAIYLQLTALAEQKITEALSESA